MIIKNKSSLIKGKNRKLKADALKIIECGIKVANPFNTIQKWITLKNKRLQIGERSYNLEKFRHIYVIGAGKASGIMAYALEKILGDWITEGIVNVRYGHTVPTFRIRLQEAGHPLPDKNTLKGTGKILEILQRADERDLIICLISGGGSALMESLCSNIELRDLIKITQLLLRVGANIDEINTIRKHISKVKGGQLARLAYPATTIGLILSDVVGDRLDVIASGPTVPDPTTFRDAYKVLEKYKLLKATPESILKYIREGMEGLGPETPKGGKIFTKAYNLIIGSNRQALDAAAAEAVKLGYNTLLLSSLIEGESREVGKVHAGIAKEIKNSNTPIRKRAAVISGGETTVTLEGNEIGIGGPNQEFILNMAISMRGVEGFVAGAVDSDGIDGAGDAAGALCDGFTVFEGEAVGLDANKELAAHNSYHYFKKINSLIVTGPTGTNVNDLRVILIR